MKEYAKKKIIENAGEINAEAYETKESIFTTFGGDTKDLELYGENENLEYLKQLESDYIERKFTKAEKQRINAAGRAGKDEVKSQIKEERRAEFKHVILAQAQKSENMKEANTSAGNLEAFATKLMLSLNYLSTQPFYKRMGLVDKLQNTAGMLGDIIKFGNKTLEADEALFNATLYTITTMFGYVKKNLEELKTNVNEAFAQAEQALLSEDEQEKEMLASELSFKDEELKTINDLSDGANSIGNYIVRLESRGVEASRKLSQKGGKVKWHELYNSTFTSEVIKEKKVSEVDANSSEVFKIQRKKENRYFKGGQKTIDGPQFVADLLIEDEALKNRYLTIKDNVREREHAYVVLYHLAKLKQAYEKSLLIKDKKGEEYENVVSELHANIASIKNNLSIFRIDVSDNKLLAIAREHGKMAYSIVEAHGNASLNEGADLTIRNQATEHLAFLLGADKLIVKSKDAVLQSGKEKKQGVVMEEARGKKVEEILKNDYESIHKKWAKKEISDPEPTVVLSREAMDQMMTLKFMDAMSGKGDRSREDLYAEYSYDEKTHRIIITSVNAIDNDMAFGNSTDVGQVISKITGEFRYNYCPRALYETVKTITPELLRQNMANYIEPEYMDALINRFMLLKKKIVEAKEKMDKEGKGLLDGKADIFDNVEEYTDAFKSSIM